MTDQPQEQDQPKRSRGGQPGNSNARKFGFYSRNFLFHDPRRNTNPPTGDIANLTTELFHLRNYYNGLAVTGFSASHYREKMEILRALSLAAIAMSRLYAVHLSILSLQDQAQEFYTENPGLIPPEPLPDGYFTFPVPGQTTTALAIEDPDNDALISPEQKEKLQATLNKVWDDRRAAAIRDKKHPMHDIFTAKVIDPNGH